MTQAMSEDQQRAKEQSPVHWSITQRTQNYAIACRYDLWGHRWEVKPNKWPIEQRNIWLEQKNTNTKSLKLSYVQLKDKNSNRCKRHPQQGSQEPMRAKGNLSQTTCISEKPQNRNNGHPCINRISAKKEKEWRSLVELGGEGKIKERSWIWPEKGSIERKAWLVGEGKAGEKWGPDRNESVEIRNFWKIFKNI